MASANPNWRPHIKRMLFPHTFLRGWNRHTKDGAARQPFDPRTFKWHQSNALVELFRFPPSKAFCDVWFMNESQKRGRASWAKSLTFPRVLFLRSFALWPRARLSLLYRQSFLTTWWSEWGLRYSTSWLPMCCPIRCWMTNCSSNAIKYRVYGSNQYQ